MRFKSGLSTLVCSGMLALIATLGVGCGSAAPGLETAPVEGVVTLDDKAIEGAVVKFFDEAGQNNPAAGTTDAEGKYKLSSSQFDGAQPGKYKVVIEYLTDLEGKPIKAEAGKDSTMLAMEGKAKQILHSNYADFGMTSLRAEVKSGSTNKLDFKLRTDGT